METCEICGNENKLLHDRHHITSRCYGGKDNSDNIAIICVKCHRLTHHGKIILYRKFDSTKGKTLVFRTILENSEDYQWAGPEAQVFLFGKN